MHEVHVISDLLKRIVKEIEEDIPIYSTVSWSAWIRSFDFNMIIKVRFVCFIRRSIENN